MMSELAERKELGICRDSGGPVAYEGGTFCWTCLEAMKDRYAASAEGHP